eukprot:COSAG03_NODE_56_length_15957_cov_538.173225_11_plen_79_part_00
MSGSIGARRGSAIEGRASSGGHPRARWPIPPRCVAALALAAHTLALRLASTAAGGDLSTPRPPSRLGRGYPSRHSSSL